MFRDLVTGLDGTPMPSFGAAMTADQRWDVVHYIRTLSDHKMHGKLTHAKVKIEPISK
jgi:mono/diheme cytochrome c family protein